ncbi:hypothetical protein NW762_006634 [Fusarium torreyae]|uniref:Uncharacterized protein n=1 Tax=Fusarium torreyae TaxID=1237075 RepID=A0A9W8S0U5_9HYPO|nr:hypothetical protein NW762_006634 [Fusarium torreyae]
MPTQEVLNQWEASSPTAKGEGPLLGTTDRLFPPLPLHVVRTDHAFEAPQSLISMHECLAARPNAEGCEHRCTDGRLGPDQDRVRNNGARTPCSLHADILAQIEAKQERRASEATENNKDKQVDHEKK